MGPARRWRRRWQPRSGPRPGTRTSSQIAATRAAPPTTRSGHPGSLTGAMIMAATTRSTRSRRIAAGTRSSNPVEGQQRRRRAERVRDRSWPVVRWHRRRRGTPRYPDPVAVARSTVGHGRCSMDQAGSPSDSRVWIQRCGPTCGLSHSGPTTAHPRSRYHGRAVTRASAPRRGRHGRVLRRGHPAPRPCRLRGSVPRVTPQRTASASPGVRHLRRRRRPGRGSTVAAPLPGSHTTSASRGGSVSDGTGPLGRRTLRCSSRAAARSAGSWISTTMAPP